MKHMNGERPVGALAPVIYVLSVVPCQVMGSVLYLQGKSPHEVFSLLAGCTAIAVVGVAAMGGGRYVAAVMRGLARVGE